MVRGGCLPVRGSEKMTWKYDDCIGVVVDWWKNRDACVI